ncbi:MAG: GHKL domain-containing protein [Bacteroidetes bacterium]|nr:GHKL domain-containing protein [Bacteroidota bacterium]
MQKTLSLIKDFWTCLTSVGAADTLEANERKYVRFTNVIATLTALAVFVYIPVSIWRQQYLLAALQVVDMLFVLSVIWLNWQGYTNASRYTYLIVVNGFVYINSCFIGYESHVHDFFYISYIVPFLLFSVRDYRNIVFGVLAAIGAFFIYNHTYQYFTAYNLPSEMQQSIYAVNLWMKFALFGLAIYILSYYNYMTETQLSDSNQKLQAQAAELQRSNKDLEEFGSIISHDLRAPVRGISSFMTLLRRRYEGQLDREALEFIEMAQGSAERMSRQIEDMLSYSKVARNLPPAGSVDPNAIVRIIEMELGEKFRERNAQVIVRAELPRLREVHQTLIHHIFQNLIANGIKFNTNENPLVEISHSTEEDHYVFRIQDNGIGIDTQYSGKVFQMFKRLHTEEQFEGTGIGLAICKKIVNHYGGDIWFESQPGSGTSFYFSLPRRPAQSVVYSIARPAGAGIPMAARAHCQSQT